MKEAIAIILFAGAVAGVSTGEIQLPSASAMASHLTTTTIVKSSTTTVTEPITIDASAPETTTTALTRTTIVHLAPSNTHLEPVAPKKGLEIRGVKMPDNCQDPTVTGLQNLVAYVEQHNDPKAAGYVPDADVAGYVCGWN